MATRQGATRIIENGDFGSPQLEVTSSGGDGWTRLRFDHLVGGGGTSPFWDIALSPDNQVLNVFSSSNGNNVLSISSEFLLVQGGFGSTGPKSFVQTHPTDPSREIIYMCLEGGEAGTYARGTGQLAEGEAIIELPDHFGLVTADRDLTVQLTPRGDWLQLYVESLSTDRCVVREAQGKSGTFDYVVHGIRKGFEDHQPIRTNRRTWAA
jgi:hypothetical protein